MGAEGDTIKEAQHSQAVESAPFSDTIRRKMKSSCIFSARIYCRMSAAALCGAPALSAGGLFSARRGIPEAPPYFQSPLRREASRKAKSHSVAARSETYPQIQPEPARCA